MFSRSTTAWHFPSIMILRWLFNCLFVFHKKNLSCMPMTRMLHGPINGDDSVMATFVTLSILMRKTRPRWKLVTCMSHRRQALRHVAGVIFRSKKILTRKCQLASPSACLCGVRQIFQKWHCKIRKKLSFWAWSKSGYVKMVKLFFTSF